MSEAPADTAGRMLRSPRFRLLYAAATAGRAGPALMGRLELVRSGGPRGLRRLGGQLSLSHDETYRQIWSEAAAACGAELEEIAPGYFRFARAGRETLAWRHHVMLDSPATVSLSGDKAVLRDLLSACGVAVPPAAVAGAGSPRRLVELLASLGGAFVVKPARGTSGGAGVTCGVRTPEEMVRAWLIARRHYPVVMAERQMVGEELRLLLLDGELLGAVRRIPPTVVGDGRRTVRQLVGELNAGRLASGHRAVSRLVRRDLDWLLTLRAAGLSPASVPAAGEVVKVKSAVSENGREENETCRRLSPDLVAAAEAAGVARLRLAGIDVVTDDPSEPLTGRGAIIEVNATPGLHYHYQVRRPEDRVAVAVPLLERLLGERAGARS